MGRVPKIASDNSKTGGNCKWCHHSPFRRTVHLLDMLDQGDGWDKLHQHLKTEFGHRTAEFRQAEITTIEFVRHHYGKAKDERNYHVLPWVAWQEHKTSPAKIFELKRWLRLESEDTTMREPGVDNNPPF